MNGKWPHTIVALMASPYVIKLLTKEKIMEEGPGKYDDVCTLVRETTKAQAAVVLVLNGDRGSGFSVQAHHEIERQVLADLLELIVKELRGN